MRYIKFLKTKYQKKIIGFGYGIQAPEYFIFEFIIFKDYLKDKVGKGNITEKMILRVTERDGDFYLIGIGKNIVVKNSSIEFAVKFKEYVQTLFDKYVDYTKIKN